MHISEVTGNKQTTLPGENITVDIRRPSGRHHRQSLIVIAKNLMSIAIFSTQLLFHFSTLLQRDRDVRSLQLSASPNLRVINIRLIAHFQQFGLNQTLVSL